MKLTYFLLLLGILIFTSQSNAQRTVFGTSFNVEFTNDEVNQTTPDLIFGFFYQFPLGKKLALGSTFSFGEKRFYSKQTSFRGISNSETLITQYYENSITFDQMLKVYFTREPNQRKAKFYGGIGYALRKPINQRGEVKSSGGSEYFKIKKEMQPRQEKINLSLGVDFFIEGKIFLAIEAGLQTPLTFEPQTSYPILVGSEQLFVNFKCGVHLFPLIRSMGYNSNYIPIDDLKID